MIGETVSHYRITAKLGGGGMGVVYRAEDARLGREVALKFLPPELTGDPEARERFMLEARAASALDHASICTVYDIDESADGRLFIAMALYDGESLKARLAHGALDVDEAIDFARQIAAGLERAHEGGIVHRDIKPANVMITTRGEAKIVDFGIAKLVGAAGLTRTGSTLGTLAYMSPEQAEGGDVGPAADLWALGVVLYEMLTGTVPFGGGSEAETVASILARDPEPPGVSREGVPGALDDLVRALLEKDPASRLGTAGEAVARLEALRQPAGIGPSTPLWRRPTTWIGVAATVILVASALLIPARTRARVDAARALLPQIETLAADGRYSEGYALAIEAEAVLGGDSTLQALMSEVSDRITIRTDPPGATVTVVSLAESLAEQGGVGDATLPGLPLGTPRVLGSTPIVGVRVERGDHFLTVALDGYEPVERAASSELDRIESASFGGGKEILFDLALQPDGTVPDDMVLVPGGTYTLVSADAPTGATVDLEGFLMDRFEVSNREYLEFVRDDGYSDRTLTSFRDRTGLPGPRGWTAQEFPDGEGRHPVTAVTWYEAAAYCAWAGKSLPTLFEWEKAARDGKITHSEGVVFPWGLMPPRAATRNRANFAGSGTAEIDAHPFGLSPFGVYAMAGNVREWTLNEAEDGYVAMGGSWQDPPYVFPSIATPEATFTSPGLGFRCVERPGSAEAHGGARLALNRRAPSYEPVDEATYRSFLTHYRYDPVDLEPETIETLKTEDWTRLKIRFNGVDGASILGYLFLPNRGEPPYQTMVYIPGADAFFADPVPNQLATVIGPNVRAGRAAFTVVMDGMIEREWPTGTGFPESNSVDFRNLMVLHATELSLGIDYLESRGDIDMDRLAYVGVSWGAGSRSLLAAIDGRWDAFVFIGAGIDERLHPTLPEALNVNFLPYIRGPKMVLNGRQDEENPWLTRAKPFYDLLSEPKELVLRDYEGHVPSLEVRVPAINDFLDRIFGPVG